MIAFALFLVLLAIALGALVLVGYLLAPKSPHVAKERRFEAGNPPFGEVKRRLLMQYVGYIYMVTAIEASAGLMVVVALWRGVVSLDVALALATALALIAIYVVRYLEKVADVKKWS